jgi:uncharacterized protein (TIGR02217 family)
MTLPVFSPPVGLAWPVGRRPKWSTLHQESVSGKDNPVQLWPYPRRTWDVSFDVLRSDNASLNIPAPAQALQYVEGFYNAVAGSALAFVFVPPEDSTVTGQLLGTGDGVTTQFGLVRTWGGFTEPVFAPQGTPTIYVSGTPTLAFTLGTQGLVTFTSAPALGAALTWTGSFGFVCRFDADELDFSEFMSTLWELKKLSFTTVPLSYA